MLYHIYINCIDCTVPSSLSSTGDNSYSQILLVDKFSVTYFSLLGLLSMYALVIIMYIGGISLFTRSVWQSIQKEVPCTRCGSTPIISLSDYSCFSPPTPFLLTLGTANAFCGHHNALHGSFFHAGSPVDVSLELDIKCAIHYDIHCKRIDVSKFIRTFLSMLFLCLDHHNLYHEQKNLAHKTEVLSVMLGFYSLQS